MITIWLKNKLIDIAIDRIFDNVAYAFNLGNALQLKVGDTYSVIRVRFGGENAVELELHKCEICEIINGSLLVKFVTFYEYRRTLDGRGWYLYNLTVADTFLSLHVRPDKIINIEK